MVAVSAPRPIRCMTLPTMRARGHRATPIQKITQLPITRPTPPTTKPTRMIVTAVQAAGVLPWWAIAGAPCGRAEQVGVADANMIGGTGLASRGRVVAVVEGTPHVLLGACRPRSLRRGGSVEAAAHGRPAGCRDHRDGEGRQGHGGGHGADDEPGAE